MKRTLSNCSLISKMQDRDCPPRIVEGRCEGYQKSREDDEPCEICKRCKLCIYSEEGEEDENSN